MLDLFNTRVGETALEPFITSTDDLASVFPKLPGEEADNAEKVSESVAD